MDCRCCSRPGLPDRINIVQGPLERLAKPRVEHFPGAIRPLAEIVAIRKEPRHNGTLEWVELDGLSRPSHAPESRSATDEVCSPRKPAVLRPLVLTPVLYVVWPCRFAQTQR